MRRQTRSIENTLAELNEIAIGDTVVDRGRRWTLPKMNASDPARQRDAGAPAVQGIIGAAARHLDQDIIARLPSTTSLMPT